jgi:NAD(P)-dependent dehydrogenase (short-subunit alcohol dehydrogenase family)
MEPIAVVTGCSSGIGFATAVHLARNGWHVFAGMRNLDKAQRLADAADGLPLTIIEMDVTDGESISRAFDEVKRRGPVEGLVNNAGVGAAAPLEHTTDAENRLLFETNYFGAVRCIQAVLPTMRERRRGVIVNVTSASGLFPWPNQACYSASKWALEAIGLALAHEVRRFGVRVVNVEPGAVATTEVHANAKERIRYDRSSPYQPIMRRNGKLIAAGVVHGTTEQDVAEVILEAMTTTEDRLRWPVGPDAEAIAASARTVSFEDWAALGNDVDDAEYHAWFESNMGIDV